MSKPNNAVNGSVSKAIKVRTRDVPDVTRRMLWGKAAGRCEFRACNKPLWKSPVTQTQLNLAEVAHIYAFSSGGPRGNAGLSKADLRDIRNLMLVCGESHKEIDKDKTGLYTVDVLREMKREHEDRIERVTAICANKKSHPLLYGSNIGEHSSPLAYPRAAQALLDAGYYPAEDRAMELGLVNSALYDLDDDFWQLESQQLRTQFGRAVGERMAQGSVEHISVFARAPQPLLVLLGTLLTDIVPAQVFQLHREPEPSWSWPSSATTPAFQVQQADDSTLGPAALVLSLSATVRTERITAVLGNDVSVYALTVSAPHNDFVKSPAQLSEFRAVLRTLLDRIKARHGQTALLHVFPAMPVSLAVELGRVRQPKADMPWQIYDQSNARGGFIPALRIPER